MSLADYLRDRGKTPAGEQPPGMFPMEKARYLNRTINVRKGIGKFINPMNAAEVADHLPQPGAFTLGIVGGNFVFGDIIGHFTDHHETIDAFYCSTLSLSVTNAQMLIAIAEKSEAFALWVSHFFVNCDKGPHAVAVKMMFDAGIDLYCSRTHAKIILIKAEENHYVIEGSANLRSSANAEQLVIFNSQEAYEFRKQNLYELATEEIDKEAIIERIEASKGITGKPRPARRTDAGDTGRSDAEERGEPTRKSRQRNAALESGKPNGRRMVFGIKGA